MGVLARGVGASGRVDEPLALERIDEVECMDTPAGFVDEPMGGPAAIANKLVGFARFVGKLVRFVVEPAECVSASVGSVDESAKCWGKPARVVNEPVG